MKTKVLILLVMFFAGCKKHDSDPDPIKTKDSNRYISYKSVKTVKFMQTFQKPGHGTETIWYNFDGHSVSLKPMVRHILDTGNYRQGTLMSIGYDTADFKATFFYMRGSDTILSATDRTLSIYFD